jgi:hypothetical protein
VLVLESFVGPRPPGHEVGHEDGSRDNNSLGNLAWVTRAENQRQRRDHGTHIEGEDHACAKMTRRKVRKLRTDRQRDGASYAKLGTKYGISATQARRICIGGNWK